MNELIEKIRSAVVYRLAADGRVLQKRARGTSIDLPQLDEQETRKATGALIARLLLETPVERLRADLKASVQGVKSYYMETHDGFRVAKGAGKGRGITLGALYAFSIAAGYCFDFLPEAKRQRGTRVGIGVMAPAVQDCGKNLIQLVWKAAGVEVVDLGSALQPERWIEAIERKGLTLIGISCMRSQCIENVQRLLSALRSQAMTLPVILGGIAVNRAMVYTFSKTYGLPIYYGTNVCDAEEVLCKALGQKPVEIPTIKEAEELPSPVDLLEETERYGFRLFRIQISDIVLNEKAREGCSRCAGDKRRLCPLEIGYETVQSREESVQFVNDFSAGVLVFTDHPDETDRPACKALWEGLLNVERYFDSVSNGAYAFKFPMTCPFCLPKECTLSKGRCTFASHYRPVHEQYNINVPETLATVFGDDTPSGICSIILLR